jgi:hypothetical protein
MKRTAAVLIILLMATSAFAGGKSCDAKHAKSVALTGTLAKADGGKTVFRVANSDQSYTVCHETKDNILALDGRLEVEGKLVSCGEGEGQELVIEKARKV